MAQTTILYCTGGGYAWQTSTKGASNGAGNSFYMGNVWNGDDHRNYNSSMGFTCSPSNFGNGLPIVITKISATAEVKKFAPSKPLKIYINDIYGPYHSQYNEKGYLGESGVNGNNFSFSFERNNNTVEIFNTLASYLQTGTTFYVHWWNSSGNTGGNGTGGIAKGFSEYKTPLEITWEYAATDGSLNSTSYNTGATATLTIKPQDSTFKHDITWKINGYTIQTTTKAPASTKDFTCSFSPNSEQIDTWFGSSAKSRTGTVSIITYSSSGLNLGTVTKSFTLNLAKETCISTGNIIFNSSDMSLSPSNNVALGSNYVVGKTNIKCTGKYTNNSKANISRFYVSLSGGITSHNLSLDENSGVSVSAITSYTISSQKNISVVFTLIDSRGLTFTHTKTISVSNIKTYSPPVIKNISFFRTKDGKENIEGTNLGGQFEIILDSKFISTNTLKEVKISSTSTSIDLDSFPSPSGSTYSFENMSFLSNLSTTSSYEITITATDKLGISTSSIFNLGTSQYIIHIPSGGKGLGFGATAENGCINLGWPIKGLKIAGEEGTYLDLSQISSLDGFNKVLGGPFLPISGGTLTGDLKITDGKSICSQNGALILGYSATQGTQIGAPVGKTTIRGEGLLEHDNGFTGYKIATIGLNIFYAEDDGTGKPKNHSSTEGMIWLCPVD